ncbi:RloB family protein [Bacteroides sp. 519]|uniref:RloB family protein n=1 Tax=Bacteroides sp. 519 TaxID=2302937 RepID=UPI0013D4AA1D|nr:RloB family protein [Bacteroides sp. 519]NDV59398.1 RloB domain-containing protein [Bacteroides sp. 519]
MVARRKNTNPRIERKLTRVSGVREVKQTFLIICEGINTEPDYFNAFRLTSAHVKAVGHGMSTLTLVQKAIHIKEEEKRKGRTYNQHWVVFDKDDFPEKDFNAAILMAQQNGFEVAYSNQAFEFWFLLHFNLYQGSLHRSKYEKMLSDLLGFPYTKKTGVSIKMFNLLFPKQPKAIQHAKIVMKQFNEKNPAREESSTTVFQLVEELIRFL